MGDAFMLKSLICVVRDVTIEMNSDPQNA
jgi:hypothetical protein